MLNYNVNQKTKGLVNSGMGDSISNGKISYIKLFKLLLDRRMKKGDLCELSGISHSSLAKLGKGDNVNTDVLIKVCLALDVDLSDIMELERPYDE